VGYALGVVLGALGPVGAVIGVGLLLYGAYELITNWDRMSDEEKARAIGGIVGGLIGGGLAGRQGARARTGTAEPEPFPLEEVPPERLPPPRDPPGSWRDANGRLHGPDGKFMRDPNAPPRPYTRDTQYPKGYRQSTHDEMAARWTDEGQAQGGVPKDANGNRIPRDQLTWRDAQGNEIPYDELTYDHDPACVEQWNDGDPNFKGGESGKNMSAADRADWYNDPDRLTPQTRSQNSRDGATIGKRYDQNVGPNHSD
jgi:hypothetical protein